MVDLLKTKTKLIARPGHNWYYQDWDRGNDETSRGHVFVLDREAWKEMGQPTEITVTIEPGDTLNA